MVLRFQRMYDKFGRLMSLIDTDVYDVENSISVYDFILKTNLDLAKLKEEIDTKATVEIVATLADRDNLEKVISGSCCFVNANKTLYLARVFSDKTLWVEIAKVDSLDLTIQWNNIIGKPESDITAIDDMVGKKHEQDNKEILDNIIVNKETNNLTFNGVSLDKQTGIVFMQDGEIREEYGNQLIVVSEYFNDGI